MDWNPEVGFTHLAQHHRVLQVAKSQPPFWLRAS